MDQDDNNNSMRDHSSNETQFNGTIKFTRYTYPFSDPMSRAILIVNFTIVFVLCVVGNLLVLFVIARNKRMRTRTNLFLANLAVADLCVGIICIFPCMHIYLFLQWYLGKIMCQLYRFVESMNLTASMLLLEVVAAERYIAINHPLKARRLFTRNKMYFAQFAVWMISSIYNIPIFFMYDLHEVQDPFSNKTKYYCYSKQDRPDAFSDVALFDTVTFALWYILPLVIMTIMYASMASTLWRSTMSDHLMSLGQRHADVSLSLSLQTDRSTESTYNKCSTSTKSPRSEQTFCPASSPDISAARQRLRHNMNDVTAVSNELELPQVFNKTPIISHITSRDDDILNLAESNPNVQDSRTPLSSTSSNSSESDSVFLNQEQLGETITQNKGPTSSHFDKLLDNKPDILTDGQKRILSRPTSSSTRNCRYRLTSHRASRRRVVRLLIIVLASFAILMLPNHVRLLLTRFHENIRMKKFVGPVCHLLMFLNSAVNPVLYSLLSQSFRRSLKESLSCCNPPRRKRKTAHHHHLAPNASTKENHRTGQKVPL